MSSEATLQQIIDEARAFADSSYNAAAALVSNAQASAQGFSLLTPRILNFSTDALADLDPRLAPEAFTDVYLRPGEFPEVAALETVPVPDLPTFPDPPPEFDASGLFDFPRPVFDFGDFDAQRPDVDLDVTFPTLPPIQEHEAPDTVAVELRDRPAITVPTFEADTHVDMPDLPADFAANFRIDVASSIPEFRDWVETYTQAWLDRHAPNYTSAMEALQAAIARGLEGNTAMPDSVEDQLFQRGVDRAEAERARLDAEAEQRYAKRGYKIMPLALAGQLARNQEAVARAAADVAREVAIERARLEHQHVQFVMQLSDGLLNAVRGQAIQYSGILLQVNGQAVDYAARLGQLSVETYNKLLERARLAFDHVKTLALIYETELKSAMADIELYRLELDAAKLRKDIEAIDVDIWKSKIDAANLRINLYLAELKGISEQLNVEQMRIDVYGKDIAAFSALVQAKAAEFQAYRAAIDGDKALVEAYASQVDVYRAQVEASGVRVRAQATATEAVASYNRNIVDTFRAEVQAYGTEVDAESKRFSSSVERHRAQLEAYKTDIEAQISELRIGYDKERLDLEARRAQLDADVRTMIAQGELFSEQIKLRATTAMAGATAMSNMGEAAIGAQNTMIELVNQTLNGG